MDVVELAYDILVATASLIDNTPLIESRYQISTIS
jgi:hypothetical protein